MPHGQNRSLLALHTVYHLFLIDLVPPGKKVSAYEFFKNMDKIAPVGDTIRIRGRHPSFPLELNATELKGTTAYWRAEIDRKSSKEGEAFQKEVHSPPEQVPFQPLHSPVALICYTFLLLA